MQRLVSTITALALALAGGLAASCSARPQPPAAREAAPAAAAPVRPALWKVADADTTIYLFGTVHALPKGIAWYDGQVAKAFESSGELVTEIVESSPEEMQAAVLGTAVLPQGQTLRAMLDPADRQALEAALKANDLAPESFDRFEPWYAAVALATMPLLRDGYGTENGVEAMLDARAKALGRPHSALETARFQLALFDSLPPAVQKRYLRDVIDNMPTIRQDLAAMVQQWSVGNPGKLAELINEDEDDPQLKKLLLTDRNANWARWILQRLDMPGTVFVAVGAGHLAGRDSVQDQLERLGVRSARLQ